MVAVDHHQIQQQVVVIFFMHIFSSKKTRKTLDFWLQSLAQETETIATEESLEQVSVFDFKSFVLPNMLLCNLYIAGIRGGVGDDLLS